MMRPTIIASVAATVLAVLALFLVKFEVQGLEDEIGALKQEIRRDKEAIHVLRAEWSYLNRPERIAALTARHLDLKPLSADRVALVRGEAGSARDRYGVAP